MEASDAKPHVVCIPLPFQGHINAMQMLAKVLHHRGFHVTFVNTDFNHNRLLRTSGPDAADDFKLEGIPDGLPSSDPNAVQDNFALLKATRTNFGAPFGQLLAKLATDAASLKSPPVTCIVADAFLTFVYAVGREFGIPVVAFWPFSASTLLALTHFPTLMQKGYFPLKDSSYLTNGYLDTLVDWIPGKKDIRLRDISSFVQTTDPDDFMFHFGVEALEDAGKASATVVNTFSELEPDELDVIAHAFPRLHPIGPVHMLLKHVPDSPINSVPFSLLKEETECFRWLDSKAPGSVVYVNFGSITVLTPEQMVEFSWGLANSMCNFLWVIRPGMVVGDSAVLPPEFEAETRGRRCLSGWCPQEKVLRHPAVGGFLTHSGWNSTLESLSAGVPMVCWPFAGDQQTNCRYCCLDWGIGLEIKGELVRGEVERLVREVMVGKEGRRLKSRVMEWKSLAEAAAAPNGSSAVNLDNLINDVVLKFCTNNKKEQ